MKVWADQTSPRSLAANEHWIGEDLTSKVVVSRSCPMPVLCLRIFNADRTSHGHGQEFVDTSEGKFYFSERQVSDIKVITSDFETKRWGACLTGLPAEQWIEINLHIFNGDGSSNGHTETFIVRTEHWAISQKQVCDIEAITSSYEQQRCFFLALCGARQHLHEALQRECCDGQGG